ncbi:MAG TPA: hypothetical protein VEQ41_08420 [Solirubrobacterales bacterium]|nr:hypothetical protein [Solirubrobacterales bacterium]
MGTYNAHKLNTAFGKFTGLLADGEHYVEPVSFIVPRTSAISAANTKYVPADGANFGTDVAAGCPGVVNEVPQASVGKFCVYEAPTPTVPFADATVTITKSAPGDAAETAGIGPAGGSIWVECDTPEAAPVPLCSAAGLWAVGPSS